MTDKKSLSAALLAFQAEAPMIVKSADNPFYKSKYADLPAVWGTVRELVTKHGLMVSHSTGFNFNNARDELSTTITHVESGEWVTTVLPINPAKNDPQGYGGAMTYHKRQNLTNLLNLVCDDDDDGNAASQPEKQAAQKPKTEKAEKPKDAKPELTEQQVRVGTWAKQIKAFNLESEVKQFQADVIKLLNDPANGYSKDQYAYVMKKIDERVEQISGVA